MSESTLNETQILSDISGITVCQYCGNIHSTLCPKIKSIKYFPSGIIEEIVFR